MKRMKFYKKVNYKKSIMSLIEDRMEFSDETINNIKQSEKEIKEGKTVSLKKIKEKLKA